MSEIQLSGQKALRAHHGMGLYVCPDDPEGLNSLYYTIEVNDAQGVAFLRRLLTVDVKNIHRGEVCQSFILNALGLITDFVWVAHLPDTDEHFRVVFQSLDTLAWMHQVAKAFDEDFKTIKTADALLFADQTNTPHGLLADGKVQVMKTGQGEVLVMRVGNMSLLQGEAKVFEKFTHPGIEMLDELSALSLCYAQGRPLAFAWQAQDMMPSDMDGGRSIDFSDTARMFALTSHQDNAFDWFDDPQDVTLMTDNGEAVTQTSFVGLLGDKLICSAYVPQSTDPLRLLWVNGSENQAYRVELID